MFPKVVWTFFALDEDSGELTKRALAGVAALFGAWWLWWRLPKPQADQLKFVVRDAKARADLEDNFRKTIGQVFGRAAVLIGAGYAYWQFTQQQQAAHELLISNQVSKGFAWSTL
jgi:hypothetical protein